MAMLVPLEVDGIERRPHSRHAAAFFPLGKIAGLFMYVFRSSYQSRAEGINSYQRTVA